MKKWGLIFWAAFVSIVLFAENKPVHNSGLNTSVGQQELDFVKVPEWEGGGSSGGQDPGVISVGRKPNSVPDEGPRYADDLVGNLKGGNSGSSTDPGSQNKDMVNDYQTGVTFNGKQQLVTSSYNKITGQVETLKLNDGSGKVIQNPQLNGKPLSFLDLNNLAGKKSGAGGSSRIKGKDGEEYDIDGGVDKDGKSCPG